MQEQANGAAGLATLEAAQPLGWRAAATEEYEPIVADQAR